MKTPKGKEVFIFDNEGKTIDRFTIIVSHDGTVWGASCQPFHPLGFGQFCGDMQSYGYLDRKVRAGNHYRNIKGAVTYVKKSRKKPNWLGKEITKFEDLPIDVQEYVEQVAE